jgi:hypothetical protein
MSNNLFDIYKYNFFDFKVDIKYQYNQFNPADEDRDFQQDPDFDKNMNLVDTNINSIDNNLNGISYSSNKIHIKILNSQNISGSLSYKVNKNLTPTTINTSNDQLLNKIKNFENINLNNSQDPTKNISFFNNQLTTEDKVVSTYGKISNESINKLLNSLNINKTKYNTVLSDTENIKKYASSNKYFKDILVNKKINQYSYDENLFKYYSTGNNNKSEKILSEYLPDVYHFEENISNTIIPSDESIETQNDLKEIFEKFKEFYISTYNFNEALRSFCFPVGFLIKKNIKRNETNEILRNVSSQFIFYDISKPQSDIIKYDNNISYANYYSYEIQPVFCLSIVNNESTAPFLYHYLLCQNSYLENWSRAIDYYQPEPPNALRAKYMYGSKKILIHWDNAINPQNDIIGYHIYRRKSMSEPYELIKVYVKKQFEKYKNFSLMSDNFNTLDTNLVKVLNSNILKNDFIDEVDNINNLYMYAICSFDAHGMVSNYSNQIAIRYSPVYNKLIVDTISLSMHLDNIQTCILNVRVYYLIMTIYYLIFHLFLRIRIY